MIVSTRPLTTSNGVFANVARVPPTIPARERRRQTDRDRQTDRQIDREQRELLNSIYHNLRINKVLPGERGSSRTHDFEDMRQRADRNGYSSV